MVDRSDHDARYPILRRRLLQASYHWRKYPLKIPNREGARGFARLLPRVPISRHNERKVICVTGWRNWRLCEREKNGFRERLGKWKRTCRPFSASDFSFCFSPSFRSFPHRYRTPFQARLQFYACLCLLFVCRAFRRGVVSLGILRVSTSARTVWRRRFVRLSASAVFLKCESPRQKRCDSCALF